MTADLSRSAAGRLELHDGPGPRWQESMFIAWYDLQHGIGGVHRVGQEVSAGRGNTWGGLITAAGLRWRRLEHGCPLTADNRTPLRFAAGGTAFVGGDARAVEVSDDGVDVRLEFEDLYPASGIWDSGAAAEVMKTIAANHLESSGRVHGVVRLGDQHFDVDGLFHRDHSWGQRDWADIVSHRWVVGTFGPTLSFSCVTVQGPGHRYVRSAAVVRDGVVIPADDVDIVVWMEPDAVSHRGGEVTLRLRDGQDLRLRCQAIDGVVVHQDEFLAVETLCEVTADGVEGRGFCDFEVSNGIQRRPIEHAFRAVASDGLSLRRS